jgi:hypothetical protein
MNNILLVGAGQIGSRHLQALAGIHRLCQITVVDPNESSLQVAQKRLLEVTAKSTHISFTQHLPANMTFDLVIIATSADVRLTVFEKILQKNRFKHAIFEKVLFQSVDQIQQCTSLLENHGIQAWVNCPRRAYVSYKQLKNFTMNNQLVSMKVTGSSYGLACNGIHFVDLFEFLSGESIVSMGRDLGLEIFESKRPGCFELFGEINATSPTSCLNVQCDNNSKDMHYELDIRTHQAKYLINELSQQVTEYDLNGNLLSTKDFSIPPQSQLSHIIVEQILATSDCDLPTYSESAQLHKHYLNTFFSHFDLLEPGRFNVCPIS